MTQVNLCEWERNEYHDSYFYAAVYDTDTNEIKGVQTGATAYAGGISIPTTNDESIILNAYIALENHIRKALFEEAVARFTEPDVNDIEPGTVLLTTEPCKSQAKELKKDECRKCNGTGKWINPNKKSDVRDCFACSGIGHHSKLVKVLDDNGKSIWNRIKVGTEVIVTDKRSFGSFYRKGYNKPDRDNTMVTGKLVDGTIVNVALKKCRVSGELPIEEDFREKAHELACNGQFQSATEVRCAWLSVHHAPCPEVFKSMEPQPV